MPPKPYGEICIYMLNITSVHVTRLELSCNNVLKTLTTSDPKGPLAFFQINGIYLNFTKISKDIC